jgi:soluble lytic murein transglycosylase
LSADRPQPTGYGAASPTCVALLLFVIALPLALPAFGEDLSLFQQRELYKETVGKLRQGKGIKRESRQLEQYPLRPYIDYHELNRKLFQARPKTVAAFQETHHELPVTRLLFNRWLRNLGKRREWETLRDNYVETTNAELRCYHLRALYGTGERDVALDGATDLWLQPTSQPKACDPLFEVWRTTDRFTQDVAWQRLERAISSNERTLARYLLRYFTGATKVASEALYAAHVSPTRIARTSNYRQDTERMRTVIRHGLTRLAARDAEKAAEAWRSYKKSHDFTSEDVKSIDGTIAAGLAKEGVFPSESERARLEQTALGTRIADAAIANQAWDEALYWIERLDPAEQRKIRWQYWLARAIQETERDSQRANEVFNGIARQRHYYGFLAASRLGLQGQLNGASSRTPQWKHVLNVPGIERSVELFAVGDDINGRREWYRALEGMNQLEQAAAGHLAQSIGLVPLSIRTANIAEALDDLTLRFPLVYEPQFRQASSRVNLPLSFLFAITRQESAFDPMAVSSADARGLMQMLPSTANLIARRANLASPSARQLHDPSTNITLGSYHLAWLLERYEGQTPLAVAAYNAGEHRVDRWIKDFERMPMDVWVERIPFFETRNYVKNVLAFKHVYSQRLGMPTPMLGANERVIATR